MKIDTLGKEIKFKCLNCNADFSVYGEWDTTAKYVCHCGQEQMPIMNDKYPNGKLNNNDRGAIAIELLVSDKRLVIDFGQSVTWIAFDREAAIRFGKKIIEIANTIDTH